MSEIGGTVVERGGGVDVGDCDWMCVVMDGLVCHDDVNIDDGIVVD